MVIIETLVISFGGGLGGTTTYLSHRIDRKNEVVLMSYDTIVDMQEHVPNNQATIHEFKNACVREHDLRYGSHTGYESKH